MFLILPMGKSGPRLSTLQIAQGSDSNIRGKQPLLSRHLRSPTPISNPEARSKTGNWAPRLVLVNPSPCFRHRLSSCHETSNSCGRKVECYWSSGPRFTDICLDLRKHRPSCYGNQENTDFYFFRQPSHSASLLYWQTFMAWHSLRPNTTY